MEKDISSSSGFTLIELMVVVAIIGILGAIVYPMYIEHIVKSKRSGAESTMFTIAGKEEQYVLDARTYFCTTGGCANVLSGGSLPYTIPTEISSTYTITVTATDASANSPPAYTITAQPIGDQASRDTKCGTLTLDQAGNKTISGSSTVAACW